MHSLICSACGYDLAGVPMNAESDTRCPECGAVQPAASHRAECEGPRLLRALVRGIVVGAVPVFVVLFRAANDSGWGSIRRLHYGVPIAVGIAAITAALLGASVEGVRILRGPRPRDWTSVSHMAVVLAVAAVLVDGGLGLIAGLAIALSARGC